MTAHQATVFDMVRTDAWRRAALSIVAVVAGSLLLAAAAHVRMPLPGSPVPITMQTFVVILLGITLGPARGAGACLTYFAQAWAVPGMSAMPITVTGGYIIGFACSAWIIGTLYRRGCARTTRWAILAAVPANLIVLALGTLWLWTSLGVGMEQAWAIGFAPFIPVEIAKIILTVPLLRAVSQCADGVAARLDG